MPEKEAELTALETTESAALEDSAEATETAGIEANTDVEPPPVIRSEFDQLKTENEKLKAERDQLVDRLARLQAEFENARKRAERLFLPAPVLHDLRGQLHEVPGHVGAHLMAHLDLAQAQVQQVSELVE